MAEVTEYSSLEVVRHNLTEITMALWMITSDKTNYGTVLSYATDTNDNALILSDYGG